MRNSEKVPALIRVGERLKELRESCGYSNYKHIAYELEMSRSAYWRIEAGDNFELKTLVKICSALGVTLEEFFVGIDFPKVVKKTKKTRLRMILSQNRAVNRPIFFILDVYFYRRTKGKSLIRTYMSIRELVKRIIEFAYLKKDKGYEDLTEEKYKTDLKVDTDPKFVQAAYDKAWASKNFEIDNYWKRATYFWAFQVASFTAYMAFLSSNYYQNTPYGRQLLFFIVCIGFITALAWVLINIGSKFWQRNWEKHIDMLEDKVTGPLYKTVYMYKTEVTFSVSKINEIVSRFFVGIWVMLGFKYCGDNLNLHGTWRDIAIYEISAFLFTLYFVIAMFNGYGRGRFGANNRFDFKRRIVFK